MDMEQLEKELRRKEEKMEVEAVEKAKRKNKESLLEDLVSTVFSSNKSPGIYFLTCVMELVFNQLQILHHVSLT